MSLSILSLDVLLVVGDSRPSIALMHALFHARRRMDAVAPWRQETMTPPLVPLISSAHGSGKHVCYAMY